MNDDDDIECEICGGDCAIWADWDENDEDQDEEDDDL